MWPLRKLTRKVSRVTAFLIMFSIPRVRRYPPPPPPPRPGWFGSGAANLLVSRSLARSGWCLFSLSLLDRRGWFGMSAADLHSLAWVIQPCRRGCALFGQDCSARLLRTRSIRIGWRGLCLGYSPFNLPVSGLLRPTCLVWPGWLGFGAVDMLVSRDPNARTLIAPCPRTDPIAFPLG